MDLPLHADQDSDHHALDRHLGPRREDRGGALGARPSSARPSRPRLGRASLGRSRSLRGRLGKDNTTPGDRAHRSQASTQASAAARVSEAGTSASEEAALSTSRTREATSRAKEALRAAQADFATKNRRLPEAEAPAGGLPLVPAALAVGLPAAPVPLPALGHSPARSTLLSGTSHQDPPSEVAADSRTRRPGDTDFLQGSVACTAAEPNKCLLPEAAKAVVSSACRLLEELPEDDLSANMAWI